MFVSEGMMRLCANRVCESRFSASEDLRQRNQLRISWLWDGGVEVRLGDEVNGFLAEETVR
jgi:hypothetical protein